MTDIQDNFERMVAMTTGNRKKNLQDAFNNLEIMNMGLTETQKTVLMIAMEVRPWSL